MEEHAPLPGHRERFRSDLTRLAGDPPGRVGVAVSGGADSLALLLLCRSVFVGQVEAATVDHQLRPESRDEAAYVAGICDILDIRHERLDPAAPIAGNVQAGARKVRYERLEQWRQTRKLSWIATAHHADDQAETLLMRLNRGSGVAGLSAIRPVNGHIVRPLLGWRRRELEAVVARAGLDPVVDPSNSDSKFDRVRLRLQLASCNWIDSAALARSAGALGEAEAALEWAADRLWQERVERSGDRFTLDPAELPSELRRRLVRRLLAAVDPKASPRGDELSNFVHRLEGGKAATLADVKGESGEVWAFEPSPPRRPRTSG